jgi:hypothetical protein
MTPCAQVGAQYRKSLLVVLVAEVVADFFGPFLQPDSNVTSSEKL